MERTVRGGLPRWPAVLGAALLAACSGETYQDTEPSPARLLRQRPYTLIAPPTQSGPAPLLVVLYGQCGGLADLEATYGLTSTAAQTGAFVAVPEGSVNDSLCAFWNASGNGHWPWDEAYLAAVIADVQSRQPIDPQRVYVFGRSLGAFMALRFACVHAELIAGVGSEAGLVSTRPGFCAPARPVAMLDIHGDADSVISYDGSPFIGDPPVPTSPSAHDTTSVFAARNGCAGNVAATGEKLDLDSDLPGAETIVEAAPGCPQGGAVELWTIHGADHWPATDGTFLPRVLGWLDGHRRK
jgi:polyhydroxybutyrate depolymerase